MSIGCKKKMIPKIAWETYIKTPIGISPFPNAILETARRNQVPFMGQVVSKSTYALGVFCNPWVLQTTMFWQIIYPNTFISKCWGVLILPIQSFYPTINKQEAPLWCNNGIKYFQKWQLIMKFAILKIFFITRVVVIVKASFMLEKQYSVCKTKEFIIQ